MALGTALAGIAGSLAAGAASTIGSRIFGKTFGGSSSSAPLQTKFQAPGFSGGGLTARWDPSGVNVASSRSRADVIGKLAATFPQQAAALKDIRSQVKPGMSQLRDVRLAEVRNAQTRAIGDLRENLAARRVMGSSFATDALARAEAEFVQRRDYIAAESFMQELEMTHGLLNEEFEVSRGAFETRLTEMNIQAELKKRDSAGSYYGKIVDPIAKTIGEETKSLLT
jgi:hypothetical protein